MRLEEAQELKQDIFYKFRVGKHTIYGHPSIIDIMDSGACAGDPALVIRTWHRYNGQWFKSSYDKLVLISAIKSVEPIEMKK